MVSSLLRFTQVESNVRAVQPYTYDVLHNHDGATTSDYAEVQLG
jgi:hypothetical protein